MNIISDMDGDRHLFMRAIKMREWGDCGIATLATFLGETYEYVKHAHFSDWDGESGVSTEEMQEACLKEGIPLYPARSYVPLPGIQIVGVASLNIPGRNHWITIRVTDTKKIEIYDSTTKIQHTKATFDNGWHCSLIPLTNTAYREWCLQLHLSDLNPFIESGVEFYLDTDNKLQFTI